MRVALVALALVLGVLGILILVAAGAGNAAIRIPVGLVLLAAAGVIGWIGRPKALEVHQHVHQTVEISGDVRLQNATCAQCGAPIPADSVKVRAGAVWITCKRCGAEAQLEEAPKW